jgi:hypothetical protein
MDVLGGLFCLVGLGVLMNVYALFFVNDLWNFFTLVVDAAAFEV